MVTKFIPGFNVDCILGGTAINPQKERLDPNCKGQFPYGGVIDILIATPGRLMEHITDTDGFALRLLGCQTLILDEVDQLLETGFQRNIEFIIRHLPQDTRQTLCFSATVPSRLKSVLQLALKPEHVVVDCVGEADVDTHEKIEQSYIIHTVEISLVALYLSLRQEMAARPDDYKILCFLPTARHAQFLTAVLTELGLDVMEIHSRKNQAQRTATSNTFRAASKAILLSSDISARGVDYPNISLVIQIGAPGTKEVYVQRLGRTGRAGEKGVGLLLLTTYEKPFLTQLKDLPMTDLTATLQSSISTDENIVLAEQIHAAASRVDEDLAIQTYLAWMKNLNGVPRKLFKWSKQDLVDNANLFANHVLGRDSPPPVPRDVITTMGLVELLRLNLVDASSDLSAFDSELSLCSLQDQDQDQGEAVDEWVLRPLTAEICPVFRKDAKAVIESLKALTSSEILALQDQLLVSGDAGVTIAGGFLIKLSMVTITKKEKIGRIASSNSLSSIGVGAGSKGTGRASCGPFARSSASENDLATLSKGAAAAAAVVAVNTAPAVAVAPPTEDEMNAAKERVILANKVLRAISSSSGATTGQSEEASAAQKDLLLAKAELKKLTDLMKVKK